MKIYKAAVDRIGETYGRLTIQAVIIQPVKGKRSYPQALCACACGNTKKTRLRSLIEGVTKSCGCLHREAAGRRQLKGRVAGEWGMFTVYRRNAKRRCIVFALSFEEFTKLVYGPCFYCGVVSSIVYLAWSGNGIDRVNNDGGYSIDNTVPCCKNCNIAKREMSQEDFLELCRTIAKRHPKG